VDARPDGRNVEQQAQSRCVVTTAAPFPCDRADAG